MTSHEIFQNVANLLIDASLLFGTISVAAMLPLGGSACGGCSGEGLRGCGVSSLREKA